MKNSLLVCLLVSSAAFCLNLNAQTGSKKTTAPAPRTASAETQIPADAVKQDDGSFKYKDAKGKTWIYRNTPFGVSRFEEKPVDATATPFGKSKEPAVAPKPVEESPTVNGKQLTVAYDEGDTVRFERPTPFGTSVWRKKKTELDANEQKLLDEQKSKNQ